MTISPTRRGLEALRVIAEWRELYGSAPTIAELQVELDLLSRNGVHRILEQLVERGWLAADRPRGRVPALLHRPPRPDFATPEFRLADCSTGLA